MKTLEKKHPLAIRWFHWINFPLLAIMIWSGTLIYWANAVYRVGFGKHTLEAWGEDAVKRFVYEAVEESLKLEKALARMATPHKIAVLHYAPIQATVEGEPPAIFPFLGSSRLEEPLDRYQVTAVFHGHSHHGKAEGKTKSGIPVYNVSLPVLRQAGADQPHFRVLELAVATPVPELAKT